ncbi:M57 family metalloprotease [Sphingobacterium spiritivorum]|uniref:M57 family metalloprotease n=1 Tax=Sphingobacterium spiritivorum TaxID=258 RepID=UPI003DA4449F
MKNSEIKCAFFLILLSILTLFSCQKPVVDSIEQNTKIDSTEIIYKALSKLRIPLSDISMNGDTILVEDIILYKSLLLKEDYSTNTRQATTRQWPRLFTQNITVKFPQTDMYGFGFSTNEVNIMKEGFNLFLRSNLNNGGGINSFYFTRDPNIGAHVTVNLRTFSENSNICGTGEYATSYRNGNEYGVRPGNNININLNYLRGRKGKTKLSREQLILLIAHEFGHVIGLRHTNWAAKDEAQTNGSVGAYPIIGTVSIFSPDPNPDPSSVFNASNCGVPFVSFTEKDKVAIKYITNDAQTSPL